MIKMTAQELRQKYLTFFKKKGHTIISSASLVPENDPTTLFTTAGMHPLVPYIMGEKHPGGKQVANVQKCVRTTDINEVGDATHHTFFEMMGNWSFGSYFKKEAIEMSFEFLTSKEFLGLDKSRLAVSVFAGDEDAPFDKESFEKWKELGISEKRIARLPKENNWWGLAGKTGPCGPDTEMFYWVGDANKVPESFADDNDLWVEIWNDVFMQYEKTKDKKFIPLAQQNVDTGMGLERVLAVINGLDDNYKTELFSDLISKIEDFSDKKYDKSKEITSSMRIIVDHIKAAVMIMGDNRGIAPSNTDQGYIVRQLIRRSIIRGHKLKIDKEEWVTELAENIIEIYRKVYNELDKNRDFILTEIKKEEVKFTKTANKGLKVFEKAISANRNDLDMTQNKNDYNWDSKKLTGKLIFDLVTTHGFPKELIKEEAENRKIIIPKNEWNKFDELFKKHQELSRTASAGKFKGGLADNGEETVRLHTVAHLMLAALKKVLGGDVHQKGSNITAERLRFDFSYGEKLTDEQKKEVEKLVNEIIEKKVPVEIDEMTLDEAKEKGAEGVFENKYGEKVKVYTIGDFSKEICGGPHVKNTGELGKFKIKKEQSSGAGVRRIKAVVE